MNRATQKSGARMIQEEYARIMTELRPEINGAIHVLLDAGMNVFNGFKPPEHLMPAIQSWMDVRKKLNRNGIGAIIDLGNPGKPVVLTFILTGNEVQNIGQGIDPLLDLQDESGN